MGIFGKIFRKSSDIKETIQNQEEGIDWVSLTSVNQIEEVTKRSEAKLAGIFKHSTRCVISRTVIKMFSQSFPESLKDKIDLFYVDLLNHREVSNEIGYTYQVLHQSPQFLLISKGKAIVHASHYDITQIDLEKIVK